LIIKIVRALHKRTKGEKGFTLIELIVVVAVLGVLATLVVPRVIGVKSDAEKSAKEANKRIIMNALERYYAVNGRYPAPTSDNKLPLDELEEYLDTSNKEELEKWTYKDVSDKGYTLE